MMRLMDMMRPPSEKPALESSRQRSGTVIEIRFTTAVPLSKSSGRLGAAITPPVDGAGCTTATSSPMPIGMQCPVAQVSRKSYANVNARERWRSAAVGIQHPPREVDVVRHVGAGVQEQELRGAAGAPLPREA